MNTPLRNLYASEIYPDAKETLEIFKRGEYRRVPLCMEILSDAFTPVEVLKIIKAAGKQAFLLESAADNHKWGRFSFLGYEPEMEITCSDHVMTVSKVLEGKRTDTKEIRVDHPGEEIRKILKEYKSPAIAGQPPLTGGLVGYFAYDYIKYAEPGLRLESSEDEGFRDLDLMLFNSLIAFDNDRQKIILITGVNVPEGEISEFSLTPIYERAKANLKEMARLLAEGKKYEFESLALKEELKPVFTKERYCMMVEKAKHYIKEGDIFQVVLSNPLTAKADGSLFDTYRLLRTQNPSPYMFYFSSDDVEIAGASPETLVRLKDGKVTTFPLAGTRPRGRSEEEDKALEEELLSDEKEIAEHNMLVDLGRNDIGKISEPGSVRVERYMQIERFSKVMHIGSTVSGRIRHDKDAVDAIDAILPAGTLSGAPKIRACEIIQELEQKKRGIYGGAVGYFDFTGNLDTCIGIRLVYKKDGKVCVRSGAGIVYDSVPEKEYEECVNKAKAVVNALKMSGEG